jgi:putative addiction module antidote
MAIKEIKLQASGNSSSAILPKPMLDHLHLGQHDTVFAVEVEGGILLTPYDATFREAMAIGDEGIRMYRNAYRELAGK